MNKTLQLILFFVGLLILSEIVALIWLYTTVESYKSFWTMKSGQQGEVTYLALGDSTAQGIGATSPMRGYVGLVATRLESRTGKSVKIINISKTGATMADYLKEQAPQLKKINADYVTVEIGANDVASFESDKFRANFQKVLATLPDGAHVANMPLFNSRPGSTAKAKRASQVISEEMQKYPKLKLVDVQKQTTDNSSIFGFAPDLFHPNNASYKNWANAFWNSIDTGE
jgi:lysophospholipase L1-like esterase